MKKKMIIPVFLALSIVMAMFASTAAALFVGPILISGPGIVWQIPNDADDPVTYVRAYYYLIGDTDTRYHLDNPRQTIINDKFITIIFESSDVTAIAGNVQETGVEYKTTAGGDAVSDLDGGPSFAWARTR